VGLFAHSGRPFGLPLAHSNLLAPLLRARMRLPTRPGGRWDGRQTGASACKSPFIALGIGSGHLAGASSPKAKAEGEAEAELEEATAAVTRASD